VQGVRENFWREESAVTLPFVIPSRALAAFRQALGPEAIVPQVAPQHAREPTRAPLPQPAEPRLAEPQADHIVSADLATILRKQRQRRRPSRILVEHFDRPSPSFGLRAIDLAEVGHVALDDSISAEPPVLADAPAEMRLSILPSFGVSQKHGDEDFCHGRQSLGIPLRFGWYSLHPFSAFFSIVEPTNSNTYVPQKPAKSDFPQANPRSRVRTLRSKSL